MQMEEALNLLDEMLDDSWSLPLSGGKCVIDAEKARDLIDTIRITLPEEIERAEAVLIERENIMAQAKLDSDEIIKKAEERAKVILAQDEAVKAAQQRASDIMAQAQTKTKEMKIATHKFTDNILQQSEETLIRSLEEVRKTRQALRTNYKKQD